MPHPPVLFRPSPALASSNRLIRAVRPPEQDDENDAKLDDEGRHALLAEARDVGVELSRWKVR